MRKRLRDWPIRIYKYRCYPDLLPGKCPTPQLWDEARRMADYWNNLLTLADENQEAYRAVLSNDPTYAAALQVYQEADEAQAQAWGAIKEARARARGKIVDESLTDTYEDAKVRRRAAAQELKAATTKAKASRKEEIAAVQQAWNETLRQERKTTAFDYGNREFILDHFKPALIKARKEGATLKPQRYLTEMNFFHAFPGGMAWDKMQRSRGERVALGEFVPTDKKHTAPKWQWTFRVGQLILPMAVAYHRPLPDGSIIKSITLHGQELQRRGVWQHQRGMIAPATGRWEWHVLVAIEIPPVEQVSLPQRQAGIDLGWRRLDTVEVRVAVLTDQDGKTEELRLPQEMLDKMSYLRTIQESISLSAEAVTNTIKRLPLPEQTDARELIASMRHVSLPNLWRLYAMLRDSTTPHRKVLEDWAAEQTRQGRVLKGGMAKLMRWRTDIYRKWAHSVCQRFSVLDIEDLDLKRMAEADNMPGRVARSMDMRQFVSLYSLTQILTHAASKSGTEIRKHDPAYSTLTCPVCQVRVPENTGEIILVCPNGHAYDQDKGASVNIQVPAFSGVEIAGK
jgi:hypothetical protein